jgi:hypothetical protein
LVAVGMAIALAWDVQPHTKPPSDIRSTILVFSGTHPKSESLTHREKKKRKKKEKKKRRRKVPKMCSLITLKRKAPNHYLDIFN